MCVTGGKTGAFGEAAHAWLARCPADAGDEGDGKTDGWGGAGGEKGDGCGTGDAAGEGAGAGGCGLPAAGFGSNRLDGEDPLAGCGTAMPWNGVGEEGCPKRG